MTGGKDDIHMKPGNVIEVLTKKEGTAEGGVKKFFRIHSVYPKFVVLDSGYYKVCALICDLKRKAVIVI